MTKRVTILEKNLETSDCNRCTYRSKAPSSKILVSPVTGWLRLKKKMVKDLRYFLAEITLLKPQTSSKCQMQRLPQNLYVNQANRSKKGLYKKRPSQSQKSMAFPTVKVKDLIHALKR